MIPTQDGIHLATDLYFPMKEGNPVVEKLPVLLQRTPYGKTAERFKPTIHLFVEKGYGSVSVDEIIKIHKQFDKEGNPVENK